MIEEPDFPVIVVAESERIKEDGTSIFDEESQVYIHENTPLTKTSLVTPTGFHIKPDAASSLGLYWDAVDYSTGYYEIQRRAYNESTFKSIALVASDENFYQNSMLAAGKKYQYRIRYIDSDNKSAYTPIMTSTASERSPGEKLELVWYQLDKNTLQKVERWVDGRPEFRLVVYYADPYNSNIVGLTTHLLSPTREHIKAGCNPEHTIFENWYPEDQGVILSIMWLEEDNVNENGPTEIDVEIMSEQQQDAGQVTAAVSAKYTVSNEYIEVGRGNVFWWNSRSTIYEQGLTYQLGN